MNLPSPNWATVIDTTNHLSPAFLLHRRLYSNHALLVECYTPGEGRFPAIARGARGGKREVAALLQPFVPLLIRCSGRGEVRSLNRYEAASVPVELRGRALYCGFYLNELIMRLTQRGDPHEQLFGVYVDTLEQLASVAQIEPVLRRFEVNMLDILGYGLLLDREADTGAPLEPDRRYHYLLEQGPVPAQEGDSGVIRGATLLALHNRIDPDVEQLHEARWLLRHVLSHYLGNKPLKSRELFRSMS